jgi:hypothetical protein
MRAKRRASRAVKDTARTDLKRWHDARERSTRAQTRVKHMGVMVLVARFATNPDQFVRRARITPRLKVRTIFIISATKLVLPTYVQLAKAAV